MEFSGVWIPKDLLWCILKWTVPKILTRRGFERGSCIRKDGLPLSKFYDVRLVCNAMYEAVKFNVLDCNKRMENNGRCPCLRKRGVIFRPGSLAHWDQEIDF